MNSHDEMLDRMREANPLPDVDMITDGQLAEMTVQVEEARRSDPALQPPQALVPVKPRVRWLRPAVAFFAALLLALGTIGIVSLVNRGETDMANDLSPTTTGAPPPTAAPAAPGVSAIPINPINRVLDLALADGDELWAITLGGVVQWDLATQTHTVHEEELGTAATDFSHVTAGADGTVWLTGIDNENLARFDGEWATFRLSDAPFGQMSPGEAMPIAVGPDGDLWIAVGSDELGRFDGLDWEVFETPYAASSADSPTWASDIAVSPDGTLWAALQGTWGGPDPENPGLNPGDVASFNGSTWNLYTSTDGLPAGVRAITAAPDGTVWAMSFGWSWVDDSGNEGSVSGAGVARFDGSSWTRFTETDGLTSNSSEIVAGSNGSIWAIDSGGGGISQFDESSWTALPTPPQHGLPAVVDTAGTLWMPSDESEGGIVGVNGDDVFRLLVPVDEGAVAAPTTTVVPAANEWNEILAHTQAGPTPPMATCPPDAYPDQPGPIDQERPGKGFNGMLAGAFDQRLGRVTYVDITGDTWGFDVCTNTWSNLDPSGDPPAELSGGLVYDADSDLIIALGSTVGVYEAKTNEWSTAGSLLQYPLGAVYDPVSGLLITTRHADNDAMELWAYDVETATWTLVGDLPQAGDLLGYTPELDRLIIATWDNGTMLLDPRSGDDNHRGDRDTCGSVRVAQGVIRNDDRHCICGTRDHAAGGMFVDVFPGFICGFDPATLTWDSCFGSPGDGDYPGFGAIVGDPINNRLVVINGIYGNFWVNATDHVWAIDLETGELSELLPAE